MIEAYRGPYAGVEGRVGLARQIDAVTRPAGRVLGVISLSHRAADCNTLDYKGRAENPWDSKAQASSGGRRGHTQRDGLYIT